MLNQMGLHYNGHKYGHVFPPPKFNSTHIQKRKINANITHTQTQAHTQPLTQTPVHNHILLPTLLFIIYIARPSEGYF